VNVFLFFVKDAEGEEKDEGRLLDAIGELLAEDEGAVGGALVSQVSGGSSTGEPPTQKQKMNVSPPKHAEENYFADNQADDDEYWAPVKAPVQIQVNFNFVFKKCLEKCL
jgi:hypothetical protein